MIFKRVLTLIISVLLAITFCACKKTGDSSSLVSTTNDEQSKTRDYITLLYSSADTFNPYTAKTNINRQLMTLIYQSLVRLDNEFKPHNYLAESVTLKGEKCTVKIKEALFSDGTPVKAADVVYSCKLALKAKNSYSSKLYEVKSFKAVGSRTIEFTLSKQDPYFANVLDFPIIKEGSDNIKDSDSVVQPPIGSGRYAVSEDRESLVINPKYKGDKVSLKNIRLINAPDSESVSHYAQIGAPDMYYSDISDGNILRLSGTKLDVNINNLVYIGVNQNYNALKEPEVRQALSTGISRSKICKENYYNNAVAATGFFNPVWDEVKSVQNIQIDANSKITVENLEEIGYNRLDSRGLRLNSKGDYLSFTLLVNSENRIRVAAARSISEQLLNYGIKITVVEKKYSDYKKSLKYGDFQLFLGEVKLTDNMDISPLVLEGGNVAFGLKKESSDKADEKKTSSKKVKYVNTGSQKVINGFYAGKNSIADVASVLQTEMPFIPVCYRTGVLFCNDKIENIDTYSESDIYFSIDSYIVNQ